MSLSLLLYLYDPPRNHVLTRLFLLGFYRTSTTRFAVLGMSLSSLLDIMTPHDFLRGLINLLHEYETIPDDNFKPKMVRCILA